MKRAFFTFLAIAVFIAACKKGTTPAINGTINGIPATTLYGTSGNATDYILIVQSTASANKLVSYESHTYSYYNGAGDYVYILLSTSDVRRAVLDTVNNKLDLVIDSTGTTFLSKDYRER